MPPSAEETQEVERIKVEAQTLWTECILFSGLCMMLSDSEAGPQLAAIALEVKTRLVLFGSEPTKEQIDAMAECLERSKQSVERIREQMRAERSAQHRDEQAG